jgi:TRAP-type C4-dicarboxylate transport system permease small subunit
MQDSAEPALPGRGPVGHAIERLCGWVALAGGVVLVGIALMSAWSIVGRALLSKPIQGDYELVQMGCAIFIACCLPATQIRYGNIIVDFFTTRASAAAQARLDAIGALVLACVMGVVAWRTGVGLVDMRASGQTSTILGVPTWYTYAGMMPGLALAFIAGLYCAFEQWRKGRA